MDNNEAKVIRCQMPDASASASVVQPFIFPVVSIDR